MIKLSTLLNEMKITTPFGISRKGVGDFYVQMDGTNAGKPFKERPTGGNYHAITTDKSVLDPSYFYYVVEYLHKSGAFKSVIHGTAIQHLTNEGFVETVINFFRKQKINESLIDSFELNDKYVEVYKNPNQKELKSCIAHEQFGAFVLNPNIYVFNRMHAYHASVLNRNRSILNDSLGLLVWVETNGYSVLVTDVNKSNKWYHNPNTESYIRSSPFFKNKIKDVLFYDEDIVGSWTNLTSST
jgi:hypothetical protein